MGEHIKTGLEIEAKLSSYENFKTEKEYCDFEDAKWVSLSWLKEIIRGRSLSENPNDEFSKGIIWGLAIINSKLLMEES